ncbi:M16 family metallopeptidase [Novipirellula artificiosorum]|uniref:Peptidase M16 inactive domain protein n=1 Tax=Novipirellula artificiosorum TaxID=2528016 RepID=A0A5C6DWE9_9BACT|nr:pitrilysin family protein [Novipirellula artificiosorum]TWU40922.1 Peptidase M16 inactive domain protein [Novipirellula artificiosorum]
MAFLPHVRTFLAKVAPLTTTTSSTEDIRIQTLDNGIVVAVQSMPWLRTAAFSLCLRAGVNAESLSNSGLASMVCEMVERGAGPYSSRDLVAAADNLGMDRSSNVATSSVSFGAAMPAESLKEAIKIYADIVRRPHLPSDQLDDARMMAMHELRAIEDEPTQRVMLRLRELQYGQRLGRSQHGKQESLMAITAEDVREFYTRHYHAGGAILTVAGKLDPETVFEWAAECFGDWKVDEVVPSAEMSGAAAYEHIASPSSQTHIGFSFDSIPFGHEDYFKMRAAIGILSDGMSSRLFDRVREQRGLCYTVSAGCQSLQKVGAVFGYAGTTPERAQQTLDVTLGEFTRLTDDLSVDELDRWKVRIESNLIMEQESSASRSASMASDYFQVGRVLSTVELEQVIESLTLDQIADYWKAHPPSDYRIVTLGPEPLNPNR